MVDYCLFSCYYPPAFLQETLTTITLLFPTQDRQWLERKIGTRSRWLRLRTKNCTLDKRLSAPFKSLHRVSSLSRYSVLEAEDPHPCHGLGNGLRVKRLHDGRMFLMPRLLWNIILAWLNRQTCMPPYIA
ncbi:hypothetical protein BKA61DRAFT_590571 [Leptodontidium sp. MPI-SDFR-AT-0119]|nr:hypothetical protein BKA61DRAFT_590571 [Leptodontidium sp. MPI-SDFR-AT-0119]